LGSADQVLDFAALFEDVQGAGLRMEVLDATGTHVLGSGSRFRVQAAQGQTLLVHVFGVAGGTGVYTLDVDVLPQLVSIEAPPIGSYQIDFADLQTAAFNDDEAGFTGHVAVSLSGGKVAEGGRVLAVNLVKPAGSNGNFNSLAGGSSFLTQLHDDLGAHLDAQLRQLGDSPTI